MLPSKIAANYIHIYKQNKLNYAQPTNELKT